MNWNIYWRDLFADGWTDEDWSMAAERDEIEEYLDGLLSKDRGDYTMWKAVSDDGITLFGHVGEFGKSRNVFQSVDADVSAAKVLRDWKDARTGRSVPPSAPFAGLGGSYTESAEDRHGDPERERIL